MDFKKYFRVLPGAGAYANGKPLMELFNSNNKMVIGKFCSIATSVTIFAGGNHSIDFISTHPLKFFGVGDFIDWTKDCGHGSEDA